MSSVRIGISPKRTLVFFENLLVFFVVLFSINTFKKPMRMHYERIKRAREAVKTAKKIVIRQKFFIVKNSELRVVG